MSKKNKYLSENELIDTLKSMGITEKDGKDITSDNFTRNELIAFVEDNNSPTANTVDKEVISDSDTLTIIPKKDWILHCPPQAINIQIKEGIKIVVAKRFEKALKSEKVI